MSENASNSRAVDKKASCFPAVKSHIPRTL